MEEINNYVILDQGSTMFRAGTRESSMPSYEIKSDFIDENTENKLKKPLIIQNNIQSFPDLENIWKNIFTKLNSDPLFSNFFLLDNGIIPIKQKEKLLEISFEKFGFDKVLFENSPICAMYSTGSDTGLVLECGNSISQAFPIYKGYLISPGIIKSNISGNNSTEYLLNKINIVSEKQGKLYELAQNIKEKNCFVRPSKISAPDKVYKLPDGKILQKELWECAELLFEPEKFELEAPGLAKICMKSIQKSDMDTRAELYKNILLIGGSTLFENFTSRLNDEIKNQIPDSIELNIQDQHNKILAPWIGAYIISCTEIYQNLSISKEFYKEKGINSIKKFNFP